jgi:hypothetical protein
VLGPECENDEAIENTTMTRRTRRPPVIPAHALRNALRTGFVSLRSIASGITTEREVQEAEAKREKRSR